MSSADRSPPHAPRTRQHTEPLTLTVLAERPPPQLDALERRAWIRRTGEDGLADALPGADALLVWDFASDAVRSAWPAEPARAPRWVHTASAGVDRLLFPELRAAETTLTNSRGIFEQPIAEYVAGLLLGAAKDFAGTRGLQREHRWQHRETRRVAGSSALVIGAGPIGRAIGRTLAALGVHVTLTARQGRDDDPEFGDRVHAGAELHRLLPHADWVICAAPLTETTRGVFDAAAFSRMRSTAHFVNVGRGPHVVLADLVTALREGRLGAASLDVFPEEPLAPEDPLWDTPGLFVSPHMSADTVGWLDDLADLFVAQFDRFAGGAALHNVVDKRLGYVPLSPT